MPNWTPGPWRCTDGGGIYGPGDRFVGLLTWHNADRRERATDEANARLVAAAPTLLAACRAFLDAYHSDDADEAIEAMKKAVTAATGEASDADA